MYELGKKDDVINVRVKELNRISDIYNRPTRLPLVAHNEKVICGLDQGLGERLFVCESLTDMQHAYDSYASGLALSIYWYRGQVASPIMVITLGGDDQAVQDVINDACPDAIQEVREAIVAYAMGNPGAARALSDQVKNSNFTSAKQVEKWVGWPLSEHTEDLAGEIWNRYIRS